MGPVTPATIVYNLSANPFCESGGAYWVGHLTGIRNSLLWWCILQCCLEASAGLRPHCARPIACSLLLEHLRSNSAFDPISPSGPWVRHLILLCFHIFLWEMIIHFLPSINAWNNLLLEENARMMSPKGHREILQRKWEIAVPLLKYLCYSVK